MAAAFLGVAVGVGVGLNTEGHGPGIAATVFIWLYFTTFSSGWISIPVSDTMKRHLETSTNLLMKQVVVSGGGMFRASSFSWDGLSCALSLIERRSTRSSFERKVLRWRQVVTGSSIM
jgi:hypothetical protein